MHSRNKKKVAHHVNDRSKHTKGNVHLFFKKHASSALQDGRISAGFGTGQHTVCSLESQIMPGYALRTRSPLASSSQANTFVE